MNNTSASSFLLTHLFIYSAIYSFRIRFCKIHRHKHQEQYLCIFLTSVYRITLNRRNGLDFFVLDLRVSDTQVLIVYNSYVTSRHHRSTIGLFLHSDLYLLINSSIIIK